MNEVELERMIIRLVGDGTSYAMMLKQAEKATQASVPIIERVGKVYEQVQQKLDKIGQSVVSVGKKLSLGITAPVTAMATISVREFAKFDQAMTETFAKMEETAPEVRKEMEGVARALSTSGQVRFTPTELAKGYEELASAGLNAAQQMESLPGFARFAQAGVFGMDVAVKQLIGSMASFGKLSKDPKEFAENVAHFSDVIVGVANETTTGVEQVARAMSADAASAAKQYGMELETLGAILGVYALQNKDAEEAGNLTGRAIRLLTSNVVKHEAEWKALGINVINPTTGEFINFISAIEELEKAFEGLTGPQKVARLEMLGFEALAQKSILPLIGQSKELRRQEAIYRKHGTTVDMAKKQMESFSAEMDIVRNKVLNAAISVGEKLAPVIKQIGDYIVQGLEYWASLSAETQKYTLAVIAAVAAIGPLLIAFGTTSWAISQIVSGFKILRYGILGLKAIDFAINLLVSLRAALYSLPLSTVKTGITAIAVAAASMNTVVATTATVATARLEQFNAKLLTTTAAVRTTVSQIRAISGPVMQGAAGQRRIGTTAATMSSSASVGAMSVIGGSARAATPRAAPQMIDAEFTKIPSRMDRISGAASAMAGRVRGAFASMIQVAGQFREALVITAGVLGYQLGSAIARSVYQLDQLEDQMERQKQISDNFQERNIGKDAANAFAGIDQNADAKTQFEQTNVAIKNAEKTLAGFKFQAQLAKQVFEGTNTIFNKAFEPETIKKAKEELEEARARADAFSKVLDDLRAKAKDMGTGIEREATAAAKATGDLSDKQIELQKSIDKAVLSTQAEIEAMGHSSEQAQLNRFRLEGATEAQLENFQAIISQKEAKKAAQEFAEDIKTVTDRLVSQAAMLGKTSEELDIYRLKMQGATEQDLAAAKAAAAEIKAFEKQKDLLEKGKQVTKQFAAPQVQLAMKQKDLKELLDANAIELDVYKKAMKEAEEQAHKDYTADFKVAGVEQAIAGTADVMNHLEEYRMNAIALPPTIPNNIPGGELSPAAQSQMEANLKDMVPETPEAQNKAVEDVMDIGFKDIVGRLDNMIDLYELEVEKPGIDEVIEVADF